MGKLENWLQQLQCNELNRGHPTFFCQSQDEFRTKESEFVRFGLITNEELPAKSLFSINEKATKYYFQAPRIYKTKTDQAQVHLPNDGLTESKMDWK